MTNQETINSTKELSAVGECVENIAQSIAVGLGDHTLFEDIIDIFNANPKITVEDVVYHFRPYQPGDRIEARYDIEKWTGTVLVYDKNLQLLSVQLTNSDKVEEFDLMMVNIKNLDAKNEWSLDEELLDEKEYEYLNNEQIKK